MERDDFINLMKSGPVKVRMNSGEIYEILAQSEAIVSDVAAYVLHRTDTGRLKAMVISLINIATIEELAST